ncbi:aldehyde dehydrogenase family protein [Streptosporangium sp. NPDC048047]|uniref:aldehyde dehydrogenase family protein n=1 Tax=Streptosporangium sp. NPDC048047 TaxID=3155748 RepID=UPI003424ABD1
MQERVIDFADVAERASKFASVLRERAEKIVESLSGYECAGVALDEIDRSVELLDNLHRNRTYFRRRIGGVTSFLPLNQPLYATACFGIVPALMAGEVAVRPPTAMQPHYRALVETIELTGFFPNLHVSYAGREEFVAERARTTEAIIFTGSPENGLKVRRHFRKKTLFILNGAGHNPLVIAEDADVEAAVTSALRVVLYNQGQDCAGPNSILVHTGRTAEFQSRLLDELRRIEPLVGPYDDRRNIVGPNSDPDHTIRVAQMFQENRRYCVHGGEINPVTGLIRPTVFVRPLREGGNFREFFAPVFCLQPYETDADLAEYFEDEKYGPNAMYVSLFGASPYTESLVDTRWHTAESILRGTDLHLTEKGYLPYGGMGPAASCVYVNGERVEGATLPQRDIYRHLVEPSLAGAE